MADGKGGTKKERFSVSMSSRHLNLLRQLAVKESRTVSGQIQAVIEKYVEQFADPKTGFNKWKLPEEAPK